MLLIYKWNNNPSVRNNSYNSQDISISDHINWYDSQLKSLDKVILIGHTNNTSIGLIRFSIKEDVATLSFLIAPEHQGFGYGRALLLKGSQYIKNTQPNVKHIIGYVKKDNIPSMKTFQAILATSIQTNEYPNTTKYLLS